MPEPDIEWPEGDLPEQQPQWEKINDWFETSSIKRIPDGVPGVQPKQPPSIN